MKSENFGKNLSEILTALEINQTVLAEKSGLTQAAISQLVNGERQPTLKTIIKIMKVIPVNFERLVR